MSLSEIDRTDIPATVKQICANPSAAQGIFRGSTPANTHTRSVSQGRGHGREEGCCRYPLESMAPQSRAGMSFSQDVRFAFNGADINEDDVDPLGRVPRDFRGNNSENVRMHTGVRLDGFDTTSSRGEEGYH
eukprot:194261-Pleurochrysis_carterae.AAC.3